MITTISVPAEGAPGGATNAVVVGRDPALLVDPAARADALDRALADRRVAHVAVTHHHPDHVGGVAHYADEHDATVWARAGRERAFAAATGREPDRTFGEGVSIETDAGPVVVRETPGHAPEHVAFDAGPWIVGDLAVAEGSVAVVAPEGDMRAYLTSLRRTRSRAPPRLYPGHGPAIDDPRAVCERLLAHRRERERRVLAAVAGGARTPDEILEAAYEKDLTGVRDLARGIVRAHLEKLAVEGRVRWDGERVAPARGR